MKLTTKETVATTKEKTFGDCTLNEKVMHNGVELEIISIQFGMGKVVVIDNKGVGDVYNLNDVIKSNTSKHVTPASFSLGQ